MLKWIWTNIIVPLVESGKLGMLGILIAVAFISAFLGWFFTQRYFTKVRYYRLKNELSIAKQNLTNKQAELDDARTQLQELQMKYDELESLRDRIYAENVTKLNGPDAPLRALSEFSE